MSSYSLLGSQKVKLVVLSKFSFKGRTALEMSSIQYQPLGIHSRLDNGWLIAEKMIVFPSSDIPPSNISFDPPQLVPESYCTKIDDYSQIPLLPQPKSKTSIPLISHNTNVKAPSKKLIESTKQIKSLKIRNNALNQSIKLLKSQITKLRSQTKILTNLNADLESQKSLINSKLIVAQSSIRSLENQYKNLSQKINDIRSNSSKTPNQTIVSLKNLISQLNGSKNDISILHKVFHVLDLDPSVLSSLAPSSAVNCETEIPSDKEIFKALNKKHIKLRDQYAQLVERYQELRGAYKHLQSKNVFSS